MKLNLKVDEEFSVKIRDKSYPISRSGQGIPCLLMGVSTLMLRTLSEEFKKEFNVYSSDLYWDKRHGIDHPASLTLQQILKDTNELRRNLNLSDYILFAHSAYGLLALEYAKLYPEKLKGVIIVGTPLNSNQEVAKINQEIFDQNASSERKRVDAEQRKRFLNEDLSHFDPVRRFLHEYIYRESARYWHIPDFDCSPLWKDIQLDEVILHLFSDILPSYDVRKNLEKIKCPIFLAAGMSDYDCCPWVWSELKNLPSKMVISRFEKSGHYPNFEEEEEFDRRILHWIKEI